MDRIIDIVLKAALLLASIGSLMSLTKMTVEQFVPVSYYWWAAVAFFGATLALAAAIRLRERPAFLRDRTAEPADAAP